MDEIVEIVRQIGRQQGENAYYRTCYDLLKQLQDLVEQAAGDLLRLHQAGGYLPSDNLQPVCQIAEELQHSAEKLLCQAQRVQSSWEEFC